VSLFRWRNQFNPGIMCCFYFAHLITRSALANTFGGIVRTICFAAFRLMMNSNFVGCSTGSSAGLTPFRILSTVICDAPVAVRARQTGDRLLFFWVRGRPRGRKVLLSPNLLAVSACHSEEENRKIVVIVILLKNPSI
jgi:hypothetical protein